MATFSFVFSPLVFSDGGKSWGPQSVTVKVQAATVKEAAELVGQRLSRTESDFQKIAASEVQKATEAATPPPEPTNDTPSVESV